YFQKLARQEEKIRQKMMQVDSAGARQLFANTSGQYTALAQKLAADTGRLKLPASGVYQPYIDSLQGAVHFLQGNPALLAKLNPSASSNLPTNLSAPGLSPPGGISTQLPSAELQKLQAQLQSASAQLQALQAKF